MLDRTVFDSRSPAFKEPFGAVAPGTPLRFTVRPWISDRTRQAFLVLHREFADVTEELPLASREEEFDHLAFSGCVSAPETAELCWYHFRLENADGSSRLLDRDGFVENRPLRPFQLTVYEEGDGTPEWYGAGLSYQIFPDRFCRTHIPDASEMIGEREVHLDWGEPVVYRPRTGHSTEWSYDFFGGNLRGIAEKLDYLASLSVETLYLCPIFESSSNHRYNTADYERIDPMLGSEEDFRTLCAEAGKRGIRVMIDGVFNHSGDDSRYFNARGFYPDPGAARSQDSPYYPWYRFSRWPDVYDCWWGIRTMPAVNELCPSYREYIVTGPNSVVRRWLRAGASAWRLDVADELPDEFIADIRRVMREEKPDAFLLGEVWEDGTNKIAYSQRRRYLLGREFDGLMNYPFRTAALRYLRGGSAADFRESMETLRENYPKRAFYSAMNLLSTHDTARMLTLLGVGHDGPPADRDARASARLDPGSRERAERLLRLAVMLLYCFPGSPLLYYGDEAGMEGFEDPFNRGTFPWGAEDRTLLDFYIRMGALRRDRPSLRRGELRYLHAAGSALAFSRTEGEETTLLALNAGYTPLSLELPWSRSLAANPFSGQRFFADCGRLHITLPPLSGLLLV